MTTYADPTRCPDCGAVLPHDPQACRVCSLPLTGATAASLFSTLQEADRLLGALRAQRRPQPAGVGAAVAPGSRLGGVEPYPAPATRNATDLAGPRFRGASVPKILLSLGALCLLVAAVIFLAVAWSWLGVGGRTVVLVALTGSAVGLTLALHRRDLRTAAEALSVVALGLVTLDVAGMRHAGWLGAIDGGQLVLLGGSAVATAALLMLVATARRPLVVPAVVAPVAVLVAALGGQVTEQTPLPVVISLAVLLGLGRIGTALPSTPLRISSPLVGTIAWLCATGAGLDLAGHPITFAHYVGDLRCWPMLAVTVAAAVVGPVTGIRRLTLAGYAVAGLAGTCTALLPVLDNEPTAMTSSVLAAAAIWTVVLWAVPRHLGPAALPALVGTLIVPVVSVASLAAEAVRATLSVGAPFTQSFGVQIDSGPVDVSPLLLLPTLLTVAVATCTVLRLFGPVRRSTWVAALVTACVAGAVATLPLYDAPLALVVGSVLVPVVGAFLAAERMSAPESDVARVAVAVLTAVAAMLALPSDRMTAAVLAAGCLMAAYLMRRTDETAACAAFCFPLAFAGLVWSAANVAGVDAEFRAIPVLLVLGGLSIWRPQVELEVASAFVGLVTSVAAIGAAVDSDVALAVHLTVAGVLVTASSILHADRRLLAWPGGVLLAAATWVRLYDIGVHVPEAYTLPSALALVAVGSWRLRRDDGTATLTVLAPGLALATVPSLVAMLDAPYSLRALVLGAACLVLVLAGVSLRWSAPLGVGAAVGTLLVLRELAPYAADVPTWLTIGISGAVLLAVGITWESRLNDVRRASRYVTALR